MLLKFLFVLLLFCSSFFLELQQSVAFEIPPEMREFIIRENRQDLLKKFDSIPQLPPDEFIKQINSTPISLLGAGWNGVAFEDSHERVYKLSHAVFGAESVKAEWNNLRKHPEVVSLDLLPHRVFRENEKNGVDGPNFERNAQLRPGQKEIIGTLFWSIFLPEAENALPDLISQDGFGYRSALVHGVALDKVLGGKIEGYNMAEIWRQIISLQDLGEYMLKKTGLMVDLLNPANAIVSGPKDKPVVILRDLEFVGPSRNARAHYQSQGIDLPSTDLAKTFELILWPLMPDHIVQSKLWKLSYDQSVDYLMARYKIADRKKAEEKLATTPLWENETIPDQYDPTNILKARQLHPKAFCASKLTDPE